MKIRRRDLKTKVIAFGLALLMGIAPMISVPNVYAKEENAKENETQSENNKEQLYKGQVKAENITKDISDSSFNAETCMEGIQYDPENESIVCIGIEAEDGSAYKEDQAGVYIASYLVVPKDEGESYTITRNITLTDTEGTAYDDENGGIGSKEDTDSEDEESDIEGEESTEEPAEPEVIIKSMSGDDSELEEQVLNGEVLFFSTAASASVQTNVNLVQGDRIPYPSYIGNYSTCWFWVNGKIAYCIESHLSSPPSGDYVASVLESNKKLQKVLYYGYGGAGDLTGSYLSGKSDTEKYVYTHIAASYAYVGEKGYTGCNYGDLVRAVVIAYIDYLLGQDEPPKGELSLSKTSVEASRNGNAQNTPDITLQGDYRNYITVNAPSGVTIYNKTKNTSSTGGSLKIYGGDVFNMNAGLTVTGSYSSGKLYGSVSETWQTLVLSTGNSSQDIGVFMSEKAEPVSFSVKWAELTRIELEKKDADTKNPLAGAVYGIYTDKACAKLLMKMDATGTNGKVVSDYFDANLKTVYVREITAPDNYVYNSEVYSVDLKAGSTVTVSATDKRIKGSVKINKIDVETQGFKPQADSELTGAIYGLYARADIVHPDGKTGVLYKKDSLITQGAIKADGTLTFNDLFLGKMYVKEISAPKGYTIDTTEYDVELVSAGQETAVVTRDLTVKEKVMKQAFQLIKISEDGSQTEVELVEGAGFTVYLVSSLSKVKNGEIKPANGSAFTAEDFIGYDFSKEQPAVTYDNGKEIPVPELITDAKGYAISPELPFGLYVVAETTVPENLHPVNPFLVEVNKDSREPMQWRIFDDRPYQFLLKIVKKDAQTGNTVLKAGASYKIYDCEQEAFVEMVVYYPKKEVIDTFTTNEEGYLILPEKLKCSTFRVIEVAAPEGYVRQGYEMSLYDGNDVISALDITAEGVYKENAKDTIEVNVSSNAAYQVDPDTGAAIIEVEQPNDEQVGSLTLHKTGEQLTGISKTSLWDQFKVVLEKVKALFVGEETGVGIYTEFAYEETGVEGAVFQLHAKETIYSPDNAVDADGNQIVRYQKDDLVATLVTDENGEAVVNNLPLGSYYLKETIAGENFVLNTEQKEFTLSAEDDTHAIVYEGISYKNERQTIEISVEKKDSISGEALEGVVFGLYSAEDIYSLQGEILIEKDTLLEKKATNENGQLTFDSDLFHGHYYVKEEQSLPGYLSNEEIWEIEALYENQDEATIYFTKEVQNQPTESHFTKVDLTTGEELEGATLQIIDSKGKIVEEWISTTEPHIVYGLPEGTYTLHEELAPNADGYVSASDITFEVFEDGSITEVVMKDGYSLLDVSKVDKENGKELEGAVLQILNEAGDVLAEWTSNGKPYRIEKLPVGENLILREITAPKGYELAEDITFVLEDTMEVQKIEMKDTRIVEKPKTGAPKTGDDTRSMLPLVAVCGVSVVAVIALIIRKKRYFKVMKK